MSSDLRTLLDQAAPAPVAPVDVDAVLDRGTSLARRRTVGLAAAALVAIAGAAGVVTAAVSTPPTPFVDDQPAVEQEAAPVPGTFADGALVVGRGDAAPTLDVTSPPLASTLVERLSTTPGVVAVASDGAVGTLDGARLSIRKDGAELVGTDVIAYLVAQDRDTAPRTSQQLFAGFDVSLAFDSDGSLWLAATPFDGGTDGALLLGLHRDGDVSTTADPLSGLLADAGALRSGRLLVDGTTVGLLTYDLPMFGFEDVPTRFVPVFGDGAVTDGTWPAISDVDTRTDVGSGLFLAPDRVRLAAPSGAAAVPLAGTTAQAAAGGRVWTTSALVADRYAALTSVLDGPPLLVATHPDGAVAAAVLALDGTLDAEGSGVLTAPDGGTYVTVRVAGGAVEVRHVLDAALRPVAVAPAGDQTPTGRP